MTRLIDADALLKEVDKIGANHMIISYVKGKITNAPTVQREGWVSVPIEPTEEMIDAAQWEDGKQTAINVCKLMVAAAPTDTE